MLTSLSDRYADALSAEMRAVFADVPAARDFQTMLAYPLGWVDQNGKPFDGTSGKRVRPYLLLLCAEAVGGEWQRALPAAASVELLHNFSLVHDDIQDASPVRHGRPAVWKIWGQANAINVGDGLFVLAYTALARLGERGLNAARIRLAWQLFNQTNLELTRGQHLDMSFERDAIVSTDEYLSMIAGKSAALIAASAELGALCGGAPLRTARRLGEFGRNVGMAFQIRDDILGIWGDARVTGKSAATDIVSRKKSLPVLFGLERSPALAGIYRRDHLQDGDVDEAVRQLDEVGARTFAESMEADYVSRASRALDDAGLTDTAVESLRGVAEALLGRAF